MDLKRVVCVGDSITRGQVSIDYVQILQNRFETRNVTFMNAGVNYDTAHNVRHRLGDVIVHDPDLVTVLVGTNDVNAILSPKNYRLLRWLKKTPEKPSKTWYKDNLTAIVESLAEESRAEIALLSLPVIGEDLNSTPMLRVAEYSEIIRDVANEHHVTYLPLHEKMIHYLSEKHASPRTQYRPGLRLASTASMQHFILRHDLDTISARRGLQLTIDTIHLNSRGASMVADVIEKFVQEQLGPSSAE